MARIVSSSLGRIRYSEADMPTEEPSEQTKEGIASLDDAKSEMQSKLHDIRLKALGQDMDQRKEYADRIFQLLQFCLFFTGSMILLKAMHKLDLSDSVLIVMMTTSSANVIAIFIYVVKYLFNTNSEKWKVEY